jgi:hypothetical protein
LIVGDDFAQAKIENVSERVVVHDRFSLRFVDIAQQRAAEFQSTLLLKERERESERKENILTFAPLYFGDSHSSA